MFTLSYNPYFPAELTAEADAINENRTQLEEALNNTEKISGQIINSANATEKTLRQMSRSRFKRIEILKKLLAETEKAIAWCPKAINACNAECSRLESKELPTIFAKVREDMIATGWTEVLVTRHINTHPRVLSARREIEDVNGWKFQTINSWRQALESEHKKLNCDLNHAVERIK